MKVTQKEAVFLLLTSHLGDENRNVLPRTQLRMLALRMEQLEKPFEDRELIPDDLEKLGYAREMAERICQLLEEQNRLEAYLQQGEKAGCVPITRVTPGYPLLLRRRMELDSPGCLWARGDRSLLSKPAVALVGSRDVQEPNRQFAREVGRQAALQGYVLVSGNARGSDREAQESCLQAGGSIISVLADELTHHNPPERVLLLSEDDYDGGFSKYRALSRNSVIHSLGLCTFVSQCSMGAGGTWGGTTHNLRARYSPVFCYDDDKEAAWRLQQAGATLIPIEALSRIADLLAGSQTAAAD